ncbi:oxysterol-binding protein-related protein 6 isoform X2 [Rhipicephalus microplus]|uniref:oxysterol-binding protein-related protein 6 isoform X2 n=1 Tax=Rhipicephalus microplus TaxID=6941 RepID=UPI003F6C46A0
MEELQAEMAAAATTTTTTTTIANNNSDSDASPGRSSPASQQSEPGSRAAPDVAAARSDAQASATASSRRRRAADWEIMQGLRTGQRCDDKPKKFEGYLLKRRKWPLKGWHKRFFCLEKGILTYAKSSTDMAKGKNHGSVDLGLSVISTKGKGRRIDIDAEEFIYHLKVKNQAQFQQWVSQLQHHRLYRQHEITFGSREAPKMTSPAAEDSGGIPGGNGPSGFELSNLTSAMLLENSRLIRSPLNQQQSRVAAWILDSSAIDHGNKDASVLQEKLFHLSNLLQLIENSPSTMSSNYLEIPEMEHVVGGQKKDRKRFHLKRIRRGKKDSEPGVASKGGSSIGKQPLNVEITVSQDAAGANDIFASMDNLTEANRSEKSDGSAMLSIRDMGYLSCSHPSLASDGTLVGSVSDSNTYCSYDTTGVFKHMEQFLSLAKEVHSGLRTMLRSLQTERERFKQHLESESAASCGSNAALIANLKNALTQAVQQNYDLRACLKKIHEETDPSTFPAADGSAAESFDEPTQSVSHESSSALSTSEFFDAAEKLSLSSSSSEEEEEGSFCSEVSDDGTEYAPGAEGNLTDRPPLSQGRRSKLPAPKPDAGDTSLWNLLCKNIGKDLSKVSMPVTINEPLNMLQRLCEELEYSDLLDKAAATEDHFERMVCIAAFAVSGYSSSYHRAGHKPFNPLLGETYECIREDKGFRFIAEQVNHHPPVSACYAESKNYKFWQDVRIKTKFWGKSMEILPVGSVHLELLSSGSHYQWNKVTTCVHNIFSGQRWVDQYGEMTIRDLSHDVTCKLTFVKASYWSDKRHEVFGTVVNKQGDVICNLSGQWTEAIYCGVAPAAKCIWRPGTMPEDYELYYGFTRFAIELNELDPQMARLLPPTDSRFRPDQRLLEEGNIAAAEAVKSQLEQNQRERRKQREEHGIEYQPMWFRKETTKDGKEHWTYTHKYWETRTNPGFSSISFPEKLWDCL